MSATHGSPVLVLSLRSLQPTVNRTGGLFGHCIHLFGVSLNHRFVISADQERNWGGALMLSLPGPLDTFHATACPTRTFFPIVPFASYLFSCCSMSNPILCTEPTAQSGLLTRCLWQAYPLPITILHLLRWTVLIYHVISLLCQSRASDCSPTRLPVPLLTDLLKISRSPGESYLYLALT